MKLWLLKGAIEHGISDYPEYKGGFPQIAGFKLEFNSKNKVTKLVTNDGASIGMTQTYKLATNDFMAVGGNGYTMFKCFLYWKTAHILRYVERV